MADDLKTFIAVSSGGLITNTDPLTQASQQSGSAVRLINYEPALAGGYRRISGFQNTYGTVPGTGAVLGVAVNGNVGDGIFACRAPISGPDFFYRWSTSGQAWVAIDTSAASISAGATRVRFTDYNWAGESFVMTDGINKAAIYDGTTFTQITDANGPANPKYSEEFSSHIFLAGTTSDPYNLYFSSPLDATSFDPAGGAGIINVGFNIVQIKKFRKELFIFGLNSIKKLTGSSIANFSLENVTSHLGCVSSDSVVEFGGDLLFLGPDGMRPVSATDRIGDIELAPVSKEIQSIFDSYLLSEIIQDISVVVLRKKSQFRLFFKNDASLSLIGSVRKSTNQQNIFEYSQLVGIQANCTSGGYIGQFEIIIHGGDDGKVYKQETGSSFDGLDIFSLYQTPYFYMEDPEIRKNVLKVKTFGKSEGNTEVFVGVSYDYDDINTLNPSSYSFSTEGSAAFFGTAVWDSGDVYDGNPTPVSTINVSGSGNSVSISYVTNNTNASHTIQAISLTYSLADRR